MFVELGPRRYEIIICPGALSDLGAALAALPVGRPALVVSDTHVAPRWAGPVLATLKAAGFTPTLVSLPAGEEAKSLGWLAHLYSAAVSAGLERTSPVLALGGGVVGDAAGFLAATYLRGVPFIQVPTTLLAQVDSAVGGKVAVNLPQGKNLVGAFYQPRLVLVDPEVLTTLPEDQFRAALGEVIKYGAILDAAFFTHLEERLPALLARDPAELSAVIERCLTLKAQVVEEDEREAGRRALLNFGHTIGHVLEAASGFTLPHGVAVARGIAAEAELARRLRLLSNEEVQRLCALTARAGLAATLSPAPSWEEARPLLYRDKKVRDGRLIFALPQGLGRGQVVPVPEGTVEELWRDLA
ncbi:MAG TPA: 3-dehydroquinate synthase [Firmicutes bacterium]|nr:3-dehydroquinate synthase [Bacillota bacterium]